MDWDDLNRKCSFCDWDAVYCDVLLIRGDVAICWQCAEDAKILADGFVAKAIAGKTICTLAHWETERKKLYPEIKRKKRRP